MTLRQVFDIVWQRRLLVGATLLLVLLGALAYLHVTPKAYEASAAVRLGGLATGSSDTGAPVAGVDVDTDPATITSPTILDPASRAAGETLTAGNVTYEVTEGTRTNKLAITATAPTAEQAQRSANAVAQAYTDYLQAFITNGIKSKQDAAVGLARARQDAQDQVTRAERGSGTASQTQLAALTAALSAEQENNANITTLKGVVKIATVIRSASLGTLATTSPATVLGIGLLTGLLAGMGVALVREQFDERLRSNSETEEVTGEPVLAEISVDRGRHRQDLTLPTATRRHTAFNESIRALRTSLQVVAAKQSVIVVTSPELGDGKTFVVANLAVSIARGGRSVIVVGGDLRRPRIGQYFGATSDMRGLANAIEHDASSEEIAELLRPTEHEGVRLLPPGSSKAEPADLLAASTLGHVFERLRSMADVVLVDTPPALALADTAIIATHTDGVVVLSTLGRTRRGVLVGTLRVLRANGAHVYGVVSNRSSRSMPKTYRPYHTDEVAAWHVPDPVDADEDHGVDARPRPAAAEVPARTAGFPGWGAEAVDEPAGWGPVTGSKALTPRVRALSTEGRPPRLRSLRRPRNGQAAGRREVAPAWGDEEV